MPCATRVMPNGAIAIVCSRGPSVRRWLRRCIVCHRREDQTALVLCDGVTSDGETCDTPVCQVHAVHVDPDSDYCPAHVQCALPVEEPRRAHADP